MALTVYSNIPSLTAQRHLSNSTISLSKSLERLSSGLRINRASDDAAGLAISEGLRAQIRGLNQAVRNANDGLSVVATAEGALDESVLILQRIRELAVQASNDTNSATNRASIQAEIDQSLSELNRIAGTVQFNGLNLLDGTFSGKLIQVGAMQSQTISLTISDVRATALGRVATVTGTEILGSLTAGELTLNGVSVGATSNDGVSYANANASAISVAAAVNAVASQSDVTAEANATSLTGDSAITAVVLDGTTDSLTINGVNIGAANVADDDAGGMLVDAINEWATQTGVQASLDGSNQLVLSAADGRNITVAVTGDAGAALGLTDGTTAGTVTLYADAAFSIGGTNPEDAGLSEQSVAVDDSTALTYIDVRTYEGASSAIRTIDFSLTNLSESRSDLGAVTNRLEATVRNLQNVSENLSASDSRIRDVDFASETAQMIRAQILQQTGLAILAQANVAPQAALSLLGG